MYKPTGTLVRSIIAIIMGIILVKWPDTVNNTVVTALGILLILPLAATVTATLLQGKNNRVPLYSIIGSGGSAILGIIMILMPEAFTNFMSILFGAIMLIAGIRQAIAIIPYCRQGASYTLYIVPAVLIIMGLVTLTNYNSMVSTLWIIVGVILIIYGLNEILILIRFRNKRDKNDKTGGCIEDAQVIK